MTHKPTIRFQRANFVVSDIEQSLRFYRDILGFDVVFIKESATDSYSYEVFEIEKTERLRFAVLATPEQANVMALTEIPNSRPLEMKPRRSAIILETPEFDRIVDEAMSLGLKVYGEDKLITKDGRQGREIGIVDRDGNLIVIYHITQAAS